MTTPPRCTVPTCRRASGDAFVCPRCTAELVRALTEHPGASTRPGTVVHGMAALVADLDVAASRGSRLAAAGGAQSGETPLAYGGASAEALWVLSSTLGTWVRDLCESRGVPLPMALIDVSVWPRSLVRRTLPSSAHIVAAALFLVEHRDAVRQHVAGGELVDEVRAAVAQARSAIDRPVGMTFYGRCPHCSEVKGAPDSGPELLAPPDAREVACPGCGHSFSTRTRQQVILDRVRQHLGTATEIAGMLRSTFGIAVRADRISQWKARGGIAVRGHDADGHPRFLVGDVIDRVQDDRPREDAG